MNSKADAEYRKRLANGFLEEARLNIGYKLWRSCTDNSQLSIENSGKMIIALFEPLEKSHNRARQLKRLAEQNRLPASSKDEVAEILQILERFGVEEHFMTDYGDETTRTDPWSLFSEEDAREAIEMAEKCYHLAEQIYAIYATQANSNPKHRNQ